MKKLFLIGFMFVFGAVLTACGGVSEGGGKNPENVAVGFVEAAYDGNADKMLSFVYLPEEDMKEAGMEELVQGKLKQSAAKAKAEAQRKGGAKTSTVDSKEIDEPNGKGRVVVKTEFNNEGSEPVTNKVKVIRSEDGWKVNF